LNFIITPENSMNGIIHGGPMNTAAFKIKNHVSKEKLHNK